MIIYPAPEEPVEADVAVAPPKGSPEEALYDLSVVSASRVIYTPGFKNALFDALSGPSGRFESVIIGIDPGRDCGFSVMGDGMLLDMGKVPCNTVGPRVSGVIGVIKYKSVKVYLGDGPGFEEAAASLSAAGVEYIVLGEEYTSTHGQLHATIPRIRDKDVKAAIRIAYRGAYSGGRLAGKVPRRG